MSGVLKSSSVGEIGTWLFDCGGKARVSSILTDFLAFFKLTKAERLLGSP